MNAYEAMMSGKHSGELSRIEYVIWLCRDREPEAVTESAAAELAEYKKNADIIMCAYCGHESSKADKMAVIEHTMNCEKRPEVTLLKKAFEIEDRLYMRIIHLTSHAYSPETCDACKEIREVLDIYNEVEK